MSCTCTCSDSHVALSIVASRLDYCNAMFGAPSATSDTLQRAQNNLARVVCQRGGRSDASPLLRSLHRLLVRQRVSYKMASLTFKVWSSSTPAYLSDLIQTTVPVRHLRSSDQVVLLLVAPRTRTDIARRAFSAVTTWNSPPSDIHACRTLPTFKTPQNVLVQTVLT